MQIKELNIGDKFYCLVQIEKGVYAIVERVAAGFEVNAYGEIIKYVSNGMIFAEDANYCESSFDKCAELVKKNNPGEWAICSACGKVVAKDEVKNIGRISICKGCLASAVDQPEEAKEEAKEAEVEDKKKSKSGKKNSKVSNSTPLDGASEASVEEALGDSGLSGV